MLGKQEHDVVSAIQRSAHVFTKEKTGLLVREEEHRQQVLIGVLRTLAPWHVDIVALTGHDLDSRGQEEVSQLSNSGVALAPHLHT